MQSNYLSISDILVTNEKVPCKFLHDLPKMGFLDPSATEDDLKAGTNVEIPLWLAESLYSRRPPLVNVDLPRIYKEAYREILNADACTIDMHKLGQYFYELGCFVAKHDIKGEVASTLVNEADASIKTLGTVLCVSVGGEFSYWRLPCKMDWPICTSRLLDQNFGVGITPEDILLPFYSTRSLNYYRPWKLFTEGVTKELGSTVDNTKNDFKISLDVQHFQPNEIDVRVNDKEIIVEGKHKERKDDHGFISRQFTRRYSLPRECPSEGVTSTLSADGVLSIVAKKIVPKNKEEKLVPIKMCGPANTEVSKITTEPPKKFKTDKNEEIAVALDKKDKQIMLREEHSRLLKPELLKEAAAATEKLSLESTTKSEFEETVKGTEKILSQSRKETDELLKLISSGKTAEAANATSEMLEDALGQCKTAIAELKEKVGENNIMATSESSKSSETSSFQSSMVSETCERQETSMLSNIKTTCEKTTDVICAELKEAAENI